MDGGAEMRPLSLSLKTIMETMIVKNTTNDNNQNNSNIKWWIIAIAAILTLINVSVYQCSKADKPTETITTDTVLVQDTVFETDSFCYYQPVEKLEYIYRFDTLYTPQDSTPIPLKRVEYTDSVVKDNGATVLWYASVSGYQPSLDTLDFTVDYPVITNTEVVTNTIEKTIQKPAPRFSFGPSLGIGYGLTSKQFDAYAGFSFTYRF